jgi:hypothetical protein
LAGACGASSGSARLSGSRPPEGVVLAPRKAEAMIEPSTIRRYRRNPAKVNEGAVYRQGNRVKEARDKSLKC